VFSDRKPNAEHLARYRFADLFLDTFPYASHTTASDALWMCVPVLTVPGHSFPSRVCGSLVRSAGLGELICNTPQDYVDRAIEIGKDPGKSEAYKAQLKNNQYTSVLFDTPLLVRSLEQLYRSMWDEYCRGALPKPDLANMDVYREIGMQVDHEALDIQDFPTYLAACRQRLAYRHGIVPVEPDHRLWTREAFDAISSER
jgi:hypothetical protein